METLIKFSFLSLIIAGISSCNNKNNNLQVTDYRAVNIVFTDMNGEKSEFHYEYNNNKFVRMSGSTSSDSIKTECIYGDSIVENHYSKTGNAWEFSHSEVYNVTDGKLISNVLYDSPNATGNIDFISEFKYDNNNNLTEYHNYDKKNDTLLESGSASFFYDTGNHLSKTTLYFRIQPDEDMVLYVKREFSYSNDKLSKELIYTNNDGLTVQLTEKKEYFYNGELLTGIDDYTYKDGKFELAYKITYNYDEHGNMINNKAVFTNGELFYSNDITYEPGKTNIKSYYNPYDGSYSTYPVLDAVSKQAGVALPGLGPIENVSTRLERD